MNNKPHWEQLHDWWMDDFAFLIYESWEFKKMLRRRPDEGDVFGDAYREIINNIEKTIQRRKREYKKIYGCLPKLTMIKKEIEK